MSELLDRLRELRRIPRSERDGLWDASADHAMRLAIECLEAAQAVSDARLIDPFVGLPSHVREQAIEAAQADRAEPRDKVDHTTGTLSCFTVNARVYHTCEQAIEAAVAQERERCAQLVQLLRECLMRIEEDWHLIASEHGGCVGGLDGDIERGDETLIPRVRSILAGTTPNIVPR
jgi:hypothetical protein